MQGMYYKTLYRNQRSGEAEFEFIPNMQTDYLDNGVLHCKGVIGIYAPDTPLEIEGEWNGKVFVVNKCFIPFKTEENAKHILNHVAKEMTDNQVDKIAKECKGDLFRFASSEYGLIYLATVLRRKSTDRYVINIIKKIRDIGLQEEVVQELLKFGVPIDKIESINNKHISLADIDKDPYMLLLKFEIPIGTIEKIANRKGNLEEFSKSRICGYIYDAININQKSGNTYITFSELLYLINKRIDSYGIYKNHITKSMLYYFISQMPNDAKIENINNKSYVYLNSTWNEENTVIEHISRLCNNKVTHKENISIDEIEKELNIKYNNEQLNAFNAVKTSGIKIITGPPGSGKTAVIKGLIKFFGANGKVKLAATTGMAAKVMKDACGKEAETVNRMLNIIPFNDTVQGKDLNDPVNADLIIVDEISMIGLQLFSALLSAIKSGSTLLLVGDEDQLQSVEYGNVLHDLIKSGLIEIYRLKTILRQSGTICDNAKLINQGIKNLTCDNTFIIKKFDTAEEILSEVKMVDINRSQLLCPIKKGILSTKSLNKLFIKYNNPKTITYGSKEFHLNDKIIMTKTNYEKGYVNGDIGYVVGSDENETLRVLIMNKVITLSREDLQNIDFAYAITIHKSQGSEFDNVYIILPEDASHMMSRRLLYTAVTRSKKRVFVYYMGNTLDVSISNNNEHGGRNTMLLERLRGFTTL